MPRQLANATGVELGSVGSFDDDPPQEGSFPHLPKALPHVWECLANVGK
jgi:hypothetical protein